MGMKFVCETVKNIMTCEEVIEVIPTTEPVGNWFVVFIIAVNFILVYAIIRVIKRIARQDEKRENEWVKENDE